MSSTYANDDPRRPALTTGAALRWGEAAAAVLVALLPWLLIHARALSEAAIDLVAAAFLVRSVALHSWGWLREPWVRLAAAWWGWLLLCTALHFAAAGEGAGALVQAAAIARFLLFVAALEQVVLQPVSARRWFYRSLGLATLYLAAQTMLQFATGHNLFGDPRSGDGELTGPFDKPRDAPTFVRMLFPALLPPTAALLARRGALRWAGAALPILAMAVMVLIGQRMPLALAGFGLVLAALLLRRLRTPTVLALAAGLILVFASAAVSPPTFYRLVTKLDAQLGHFATSPYGLIIERATAIAEQHPWTGRGYDGYRTACPEPRYFLAWHWPGQPAAPDPSGTTLCLTHPHNLYLQAVTDAGLPGLLLFTALALVWLARLGRGMRRGGGPLQAGLFIAALLQLWPLASTSPLISLPIGGWFFLLLGAGLAEAKARHPLPPA